MSTDLTGKAMANTLNLVASTSEIMKTHPGLSSAVYHMASGRETFWLRWKQDDVEFWTEWLETYWKTLSQEEIDMWDAIAALEKL